MEGARDLRAQLAELERQRQDGSISELTFNLRRNLLITRSDQLARRRVVAAKLAPPPVALPPRRQPVRRRSAPTEAHRGPVAVAPPASEATDDVDETTPQRTRLYWVLAVAAAAVVVVGAVLIARVPAPSAPTTVAGTPAGAPTPAGIDPSGAGAVTRIGVTQTTAGGVSIDLLAYAERFSPSSQINNPLPAGGYYAAVELRICAGVAATTVSPFEFVLVEPDHTQLGSASGPTVGRLPTLQVAQLAPGRCATGWISYGVTSRPPQLDDLADGLGWTIPQ